MSPTYNKGKVHGIRKLQVKLVTTCCYYLLTSVLTGTDSVT